MKNYTLKFNKIIVFIPFLLACSKDKPKEEVKPKYTYSITVVPPSETYTISNSSNRIEGANIYFYNTELDFRARQNAFDTLVSDNEGKASVTFDSNKQFWYLIKKDTLNNLRTGAFTNYLPSGYGSQYLDGSLFVSDNKNPNNEIKIMLSTTPVKLKLISKREGAFISGVKVRLFLSEEELNNRNNINYYYYLNDIRFKNYNRVLYPFVYLEANTDSNGEAIFNNLEPRRKYWFSIDDKVPTPSSTASTLPDDPNITTTIEVAVP